MWFCRQDAAYAERKHGNGKEAARYLAWMGSKGMVIIHSVNEDGAKSDENISAAG